MNSDPMGTSEHLQGTVLDQIALRDLILALALEGDTGELHAYGILFAEDAVLESPAGLTEGRDAIVAAAGGRRESGYGGPQSSTRHHVNPGIILVDRNTARSRSTFAFYVSCDKQPQLNIVGEYHDEFRREDGTWRLARRLVTFG